MQLRDGDLSIRLMRDDPQDYELLVRWRAQPHVHAWWDPDEPPPTYDTVVEWHGPRAQAEEATTSCIIQLGERPIGYVQYFPWAPFAEDARAMGFEVDERAFGIDIFIGESDLLDRGIGTRAVELMCRHLEDELEASGVALTTETSNHRAQRAYEKAGFVKVKEVLELDTRDGERVPAWLMQRERAS